LPQQFFSCKTSIRIFFGWRFLFFRYEIIFLKEEILFLMMSNFKPNLRSKLPKVGTTIFTTMSALANEYNAINLSQGFPDFAVDEKLISLIHQYFQAGMNQYAPMAGVMKLRESLAEKYEKNYRTKINPETEITITSGATEAIFSAITSVIHPEDEVIVFEPAYDCYVPAIELCGGVPVFVELNSTDFSINFEQLKKRINHKTKLIILNSPHNPSGSILKKSDMEQLEKLIEQTDILVLSDEVYEHIIFDNEPHQSVLRFSKLAERSFIIYSFGKTFHATGWKIGYVIAPEILMKEFRKVHQFNVFSSNTPLQYALADYLKNEDNYNYLPNFYEEKRNFFLENIKSLPFDFLQANGSYFQVVNYSKFSKENDFDFAVRLIKECGVAAVPVSAFYHQKKDDKLLRFCFAKKKQTIEMAVEKLNNYFSN
jgi:methionine transaminase